MDTEEVKKEDEKEEEKEDLKKRPPKDKMIDPERKRDINVVTK